MQPENKTESATADIRGVKCAGDILSTVSVSEVCSQRDKEGFMSDYIEKFPRAAGLPPDAQVVGHQVACFTSSGGAKKLDLLMYSKETTLLYAVELQTGQGDSSHTNRAIFYTKSIKRQLEEIVEAKSDIFGNANLTDGNVVGVLVCEKDPEEFDKDIADDNGLTVVLVPFMRGKTTGVVATQPPDFVVGDAEALSKSPDSDDESSGSGAASDWNKPSLDWHKPRVDNFFRDARELATFQHEFQPTKGGNAITAPVRIGGKKRTVGFWCNRGQKQMLENRVYLYSVPSEIFEAWDEMGVDYKAEAEGVVRFLEPGRVANGNQGLIIQLDDDNRTVWAKHFADAVQWVNEKNADLAGD